MKRQTLIALGVAVILGVLAVFLANTYLSGREKQLAASPEGMVRVAVAAMPLDYGVDITPDKVKFVNYPATSLPPGVYKSIPELLPMGKRRVALRPIQVNQPLLAADLSGEGQNASIAALLPDGMRAATVRINDISGVAGFVKPNDTVDVLITRQAIGPMAQRTASRSPTCFSRTSASSPWGRTRSAPTASPARPPTHAGAYAARRAEGRARPAARPAEPGPAQARRGAEYPAGGDGQPR